MNRRFLTRRGLLAGAMLVAGGGGLVLGGTPAGASSVEVTTVGSLTTYVVMHDLFPTSLNDLLPGGTTSHQKIVATAKLCATGVTYGPTSKVPNGSTPGKTALHNEESAPTDEQGCIDFARSSSPPKFNATSSTHFDYYAFALDAVAPLVGKNAGGSRTAPVTLTLTDMKGIYRCKPGFTNWKTVTGGATAPIVRFWPATGYGTRTVYADILGYTAAKDHATTALSTCTTGAITGFTVTGHVKVNAESTEDGIIYKASVDPTDPVADAIYIYSAGQFEQQWNNTTSNYTKSHLNAISGTAIGNFNASTLLLAQMQNRTNASLTAPFANYASPSGTFNATANRGLFTLNTGVIKEANEWYTHEPVATAKATTSTAAVPGVRYIYNVADTALPTYSEAKMMIGFDNQASGTKSTLCNGDDSATIIAAGFVPLNTGSTSPYATADKAGATCREFPGDSYPGYGHSKSWTVNTWVSPT